MSSFSRKIKRADVKAFRKFGIEQEILDAVREAHSNGKRIISGSYGDGIKTCCPITALQMYRFPGELIRVRLKDTFGWNAFDIVTFTDGFDGRRVFSGSEHRRYLYDMGQRIRQYCIDQGILR